MEGGYSRQWLVFNEATNAFFERAAPRLATVPHHTTTIWARHSWLHYDCKVVVYQWSLPGF